MKTIRVLIIDDSAFARKVIREVLSKDPLIEVIGIARDGLEGLEKISELRPDVVTLDLVMPELDGLGVLAALKLTWSPKVIVVSVSGSETELALEALENGAVELVTKPTPFATDRLYELADDLIIAVKAAAESKIRDPEVASKISVDEIAPQFNLRTTRTKLLVIGTSTGGPQALSELFKTLPANFPVPILIALHIPSGYTAPLAARISKNSSIQMSEARDGQELLIGEAFIAPGGMHLKVRSEGAKLFAVVSRLPEETLHHPSVDVLFESAAKACGPGVLGVILTGMGNDGMIGAEAIRKQGGLMLAESASSCVVYGMPRCVIEGGFASGEAPLEKMPHLIVENLT